MFRPPSPRPPDVEAASVDAEPVLARAAGLELLGAYERSGHRRPPSLVRRADGQVIQLTPVLYELLEAIDGRRGYREIADAAGKALARTLSADDVRFLIEKRLRPLGALQEGDGSQPTVRKADPLLGLRLRKVITKPDVTRRMTTPFVGLFSPLVVVGIVAVFVVSTGWLLFDRGLASAMRESLYQPGMLLLVFLLTTLSAGFHELGHATACRCGGGTPGAMGVGLYLVWPAFYTDVTDAYRLDRRDRLRVDLGGIYFNAVFAVVALSLWAVTRWESLLLVVPLQAILMIRQLLPLVRLDGYHILADLTGVPDLFAHIKPIILGFLPTRWGKPETKVLKPWVRVVVTLWVLVVVPVLALVMITMIVILPRVAATAWDSIGQQWIALRNDFSSGDPAGAGERALSVIAIAVPVLSMLYMGTRVITRVVRKVWRATAGRPLLRILAASVAAALVAAAGAVSWPEGQYRPIQSDEQGTIGEIVSSISPSLDRVPASRESVSVLNGEAPLSAPVRAAIPAPAERSDAIAPPEAPGFLRATGSVDPSGLRPEKDFRFNLPDQPRPDDNQALTVNYEDNSSAYAFVLSLVFAEGGLVDQANEAYALASCTDCTAVAIAFQLVVILGQADVVIPENVAAAVNAYCVRCFTYAMAVQLVVTVEEPLSDETMRELLRIWSKLEDLQAGAEDIPLDELYLSLAAIEEEIMDLLAPEAEAPADERSEAAEEGAANPVITDPRAAEPSPSPASEPSASPSPTEEASPSPSSEPSPSPGPTPEDPPSPTPEPSPSPTP